MPKPAAALRASSWSSTHGHIVLSLKKLESDQFFINTPVTSYPSSFNNAAATEESTPPLIATNTRFLTFFSGDTILNLGTFSGDTILNFSCLPSFFLVFEYAKLCLMFFQFYR